MPQAQSQPSVRPLTLDTPASTIIGMYWRSDEVQITWRPPLYYRWAVALGVRYAEQSEHRRYLTLTERQYVREELHTIVLELLNDPNCMYISLIPMDLHTNRAEFFHVPPALVEHSLHSVETRLFYGDMETYLYGTKEDMCLTLSYLVMMPESPYILHSEHVFGYLYDQYSN